tara:strand:- start:65 stop:1339 length:1275 start_codon:yes stop_codon:yes gene_type:complete
MEKRFVRKILGVILIIFLFSHNYSFCQRQSKNKILSNVGNYSLIEFSKPFSKDSILVTTFVEIPFQSLQFIKKEQSFFASYDVSISLRNKKGKRIFRKMWSDSIITNDYIQTQSKYRTKKHFVNLKVGKDEYVIDSELYDKDTRNKGSKKIKLDFSKKVKTPVLFEPIVITNLEGNWGFNEGEFPLTGKRITNIDDGLTLIISGFVGKGQYQVEMFLDGKNEEDGIIVIDNNETPDGYFMTRYKLKKDDLSTIGLNLKLIIKQNGREKSLFKKISIFKPGLSGFVNNVENSFQQMKYILTNDERKKAKGKKGKELESLFLSFWKERDPTPNTSINELMEEYYIRVNYVNEYFNMSWREGWETDFGMIYILFGPPDRIERSNSTSTSSSIYQVWYYSRLNKQFVFKDQNGFGDFKLDRPFVGQNF